jgi:hypothetical protein
MFDVYVVLVDLEALDVGCQTNRVEGSWGASFHHVRVLSFVTTDVANLS